MTPMSDVMVLLLTFFMLTSTFVKNEPVKVVTPGSVSEIKVPEKSVLNILVDKTGKIFMSMDNQNDTQAVLEGMSELYGMKFTPQQVNKFKKDAMWGVPMNSIQQYLSQSETEMAQTLKNYGIPTDSIDGKESEFQLWVKEARKVNPDVKLAIKADEKTPYALVKKVMSELQDLSENRYYLITSYKKVED